MADPAPTSPATRIRPAAFNVDLTTGIGQSGDAEGDTLKRIEVVIGSNAGFGDRIQGDGNSNALIGLDGFDTLEGHGGNDTLTGGDGIDNLKGGDGEDILLGQGDGDILEGGSGGDTINGGAGADDIAIYLGSPSGVTISLLAGTAFGGDAAGDTLIEIEHLRGSNSGDNLSGDGGDNFLAGADGPDTLGGSDGDDTLDGGGGTDQLFGDQDNDTLIGGAGVDFLNGFTGTDVFEYWNVSDTGVGVDNRDQILDFDVGGDSDWISLFHIDANPDTPVDDAFTFIGANPFNGTAPQVRYFHAGGNTIVQAELGGDADPIVDFEIFVTGLINFVAGDFFPLGLLRSDSDTLNAGMRAPVHPPLVLRESGGPWFSSIGSKGEGPKRRRQGLVAASRHQAAGHRPRTLLSGTVHGLPVRQSAD
ncbi:MAG: calcium-binding protein [Hyphomicrobiales bacterium]|nr:calcium-binding protein [Hyphomicrobiales bacterium]